MVALGLAAALDAPQERLGDALRDEPVGDEGGLVERREDVEGEPSRPQRRMHHGMEGARVGDVLREKRRDDQVEGPARRELRRRRVRQHGAVALRRLGQLGRREVGDLVVEPALGDQLERDERVRAASQLADPGHARVTGERLRPLRVVGPEARPDPVPRHQRDSIGGDAAHPRRSRRGIRRPPSRSDGGGGSGSRR